MNETGEPSSLKLGAAPGRSSASDPLERQFLALDRRLRQVLRADGVAELTGTIALWALLSLGLDRMLELPWLARAVGLVLLFALSFRAVFLLSRRLRRGAPRALLAEAVEKRHPEIEGQLLNVLSFREDLVEAQAAGGGKLEETLMRRALAEAESALRSVRFAQALNLRPFQRRALLAVGVMALLLGVAGSFPGTAGLWLQRNLLLSSVPWPRDTQLILDRAETVWHAARRDSLPLLGWARGKIPPEVVVHIRSASGSRRASILPGANGRLSFVFPEVVEPFRFNLRGGDGRTEPVEVQVHDRPRVLTLSLDLNYPEYLARAPERLANPAGDIVIPAGTAVVVRAQADLPLKAGWIEWERTGRVEVQPIQGSEGAAVSDIEHRFEPKSSGSLDLWVVEREWGLESRPPVRVRFQVRPDAVPRLTLTLRQKPRIVTPLASVPYVVEAKDDHGFSRLGLEVAVAAQEEVRKEIRAFQDLPPREPSVVREDVLDLEPLNLEPGMRLTLTAEGADNDGLSGPKAARSNSEVLSVVGPEEFREAMARARAAARRELEDVLLREERIARELPGAVEALASEGGGGPGRTGRSGEGGPARESGAALSGLGREQGEVGQRVRRAGQELRDVAQALRQNRMMDDAEERRFEAEVAAPLEELGEDRLPRTASEMAAIARADDPRNAGARSSAELERIIDLLRGILDRLADTEDFSDVLHRLEGVLQLHRQAITATRGISSPAVPPEKGRPEKRTSRKKTPKEKQL